MVHYIMYAEHITQLALVLYTKLIIQISYDKPNIKYKRIRINTKSSKSVVFMYPICEHFQMCIRDRRMQGHTLNENEFVY